MIVIIIQYGHELGSVEIKTICGWFVLRNWGLKPQVSEKHFNTQLINFLLIVSKLKQNSATVEAVVAWWTCCRDVVSS